MPGAPGCRSPSEETMSRPRRCAAAIVLVCMLIVASCSAAGSPASIAPTAAAVVTSTALPSALPTVAATDWPTAAPTAPLDLPTPAVTITPAPTAAPFPLAAGWWDDAVCYEV